MPLVDNAFYVDSAGWSAVTAWATGASIAAGALRRQNATPAVGSERVFVCIVAGTTHASTEPTWVTTRGAKTTDNTVTWQECTGIAGINGDLTNTPNWTAIKNTAIVLGQVIQRDNGASYQICTTAGTAGNGSEPSFSNTAGTTTADNTVTWTSLGVVGNFTGNQAPQARIVSAVATNWAQAGNKVFVKSSHAATQATAISVVGAGTVANPVSILCHNGSAYPPLDANLTTGATETVSGVASAGWNGNLYVQGVGLIASANGGSLAVGGASSLLTQLKNCTLAGSNAGSSFSISLAAGGNPHPRVIMDNVTVSFANVAHSCTIGNGQVTWKNTASALLGTMPTTLLTPSTSTSALNVDIRGVDLSAAGSGKTLVGAALAGAGKIDLVNCKINASVTVAAVPTTPNYRVNLVNCDSGAVNYRNEVYHYTGTLTTETTIVLTGGATDGVTPISWKVVTTANAKFLVPFECPPIKVWNDTTGSSKTLTIQGIWGGGGVPNDDEIWVEVEYLGSSGSPVSSFISDAKASVLATAAGQTSGSGTWGGSTTKFKLDVTFTPQMKGFVTARVKCAKLSSTFYIDPLALIT